MQRMRKFLAAAVVGFVATITVTLGAAPAQAAPARVPPSREQVTTLGVGECVDHLVNSNY